MKVLLINGSPNKNGCTDAGLKESARELQACGIETDFYWIGKKPISGCLACQQCYKLKKCVLDDQVNEFTDLAVNYDGFIFGTPVYYAGMNGSLMSFMDRVFYSSTAKKDHPFRLKPAASLACARRAGTTSALDQVNKYFLHQQMPVISSCYWNMIHGNSSEEAVRDEEGMQILRTLGRNMAWFLRLREAGEAAGVRRPEPEEVRYRTNFIR